MSFRNRTQSGEELAFRVCNHGMRCPTSRWLPHPCPALFAGQGGILPMSFRNGRTPVRNPPFCVARAPRPRSLSLSSRAQRTVRPANRPRSRGTLVFYFHPRDQKRVRVPHFSLFLREVGTTIRQNQEPAGITFAEAFFADTFHQFPIWNKRPVERKVGGHTLSCGILSRGSAVERHATNPFITCHSERSRSGAHPINRSHQPMSFRTRAKLG
jgi:hypothetical protein